MHNSTITFIGAGNMASALIGGLIAVGYDPSKIWACDPSIKQLAQLQNTYGIQTTADNHLGVKQANILVFAVKPQQLKTVATELADTIQQQNPLILSIAAMIPTAHLAQWLGAKPAIIRCMPNTPALIRCGATGLFANAYVNAAQKNLAESILRAVGLTVWINDETQMDIVTALSGSGPAYFFLFMQHLQEAAEKLGLAPDTARLLTLQTCLGAAKLAAESAENLATLRQQVTSPGGTTERALEVLEGGDLAQLFYQALAAAQRRAVEMIATLEKN